MTLAAVAFLPLVSGCYGGAALVAWNVFMLTDDEGSGRSGTDVPPATAEILAVERETATTIKVRLKVSGSSRNTLGAILEFAEIDRSRDCEEVREMAPADGSPPLGDLVPNLPVDFVWNTGADLDGRVALVCIRARAVEDGRAREPAPPVSGIWAGNTAPSLQNIILTSQAAILGVTFDVVDGQSDEVELVALEFKLASGEFKPVPDAVFDRLRKTYTSSPEGITHGFNLLASDLDSQERVGEPGSVETIALRLKVRDFPAEDPVPGEGSITVDNNEPPIVELLPIVALDLTSGIIPIRLRIFDPDLNAADLQIAVSSDGGVTFDFANEFPSRFSNGRTGLTSLPLSDLGRVRTFQTFLWDAASQLRETEELILAVNASDEEPGSRVLRRISGLSFSTLVREADLETDETPLAATSGDFDQDGFTDVVVANFQSNNLTVFRGSSRGLVRESEAEAGFSPVSLVSGDYDGDGFWDFVVANELSGDVSYYRGATTLLREPSKFEAGARPRALLNSDIDRDGYLDVAVLNGAPFDLSSIFFFRGGVEGLSPGGSVVIGEAPQALTGGDYDGDGFFDIAVLHQDPGSVRVLRGSEKGFAPIEEPLQVGSFPVAVATADYNGDSYADVVVVNQDSDDVTYLRGGASGLGGAESIPVGDSPVALASADFDGDGVSDVVVVNQNSNDVTCLKGSKTGLLRGKGHDPGVGVRPIAIATGDFNGDGFPDVVVANSGPRRGTVTYLLGSRAGLLRAAEIEVGRIPLDLTTGDYNGDGIPDVGVVNRGSNTLTYLSGDGGGLTLETVLEAGIVPTSLTSADVTGDGIRDAVVVNRNSSTLTFYEGSVDGLDFSGEADVGRSPVAVTTADYDGDGALEVVVANEGSDTVSLFEWGEAGPLPVGEIDVGEGPFALASGQFNGDPFADVVVANSVSGTVTYLEGGETGLSYSGELEVGTGPRALLSGHFDRDEHLDLLVANGRSNNVSFLRGGEEGLSHAGEIPVGSFPAAMSHGDFNGDGFRDVVVVNENSQNVTVLDGNAGGLSPGAALRVGNIPVAVASADFDSDGFPDVAVANWGAKSVSVLAGGPAGLSSPTSLQVGPNPLALVCGDFNGDGFPDVLTANVLGASVTFLRGGVDGLRPAGELEAGESPSVLSADDYNGDGLLDVLVANRVSNDLSYFRQRYLAAHTNVLLEAEPDAPVSVLDERNPPRYCLELPTDAFGSPSPRQVCMVRAPVPDLPHEEARYLVVVSGPVAILRETSELQTPATLTLRVRAGVLLPQEISQPERLQVLRWDSQNRHPERLEDTPALLDLDGKATAPDRVPPEIASRGGLWIQISIERFGTYAAVVQRDRGSKEPGGG